MSRLETLTNRVQGRELGEARLAAENARLRERVGELEAALVHISIQDGEELTPLDNCDAHTLADALRHCGEVARAALKGAP